MKLTFATLSVNHWILLNLHFILPLFIQYKANYSEGLDGSKIQYFLLINWVLHFSLSFRTQNVTAKDKLTDIP